MTGITFSDSERQKFRDEPKHLHDFRRKIEISANKVHPITVRGTPLQKSAEAAFEDSMRQKLAKRPDIFEKIKPSFAPGCRRLTPGPGFLEALVEDNVSFISDKIEKIAPKGIVTSDGKLHEIDVLVCEFVNPISSATSLLTPSQAQQASTPPQPLPFLSAVSSPLSSQPTGPSAPGTTSASQPTPSRTCL